MRGGEFYLKFSMDIEIEDGARKTYLAEVLAAASLGKASALCYCLINMVKTGSNTTLNKHHFK
jgi:hypothetical protein